MSLVVVGLNHRTVPVELLERLTVAPEALPKALQSLGGAEHLAEVVLLSTCNRTEVYAKATLFHPAMQEVRDFLADTSGVDPDGFIAGTERRITARSVTEPMLSAVATVAPSGLWPTALSIRIVASWRRRSGSWGWCDDDDRRRGTWRNQVPVRARERRRDRRTCPRRDTC